MIQKMAPLMKLKKIVLPVLACLLPLSAATASAAELQRADVEQIVREYMVSHPELLIEMSNALRAKQEAEQSKADVDLIQQHSKALFQQANDPVGGNAKGTQTIVEFLDYNCGYCKRATPAMHELLASDPSIRVIYKEFPILSETSYLAAKAALAVQSLHPEQFVAFHNALMERQGSLKDENDVAAIAKQVKLNWPAVQKKMQDPAIEQQLKANHQLAQQLGLTGTPAFVIGDTILRGAPRTADDLRALLKPKS